MKMQKKERGEAVRSYVKECAAPPGKTLYTKDGEAFEVFEFNQYLERFPTASTYVFGGSRGPGKTYQYKVLTLEQMLKGKQTAYCRMKKTEIAHSLLCNLWSDVVADGTLEKYAKRKFPEFCEFSVEHVGNSIYLYGTTEGGKVKQLYELSKVFALRAYKDYKSYSYPDIDYIFCDEVCVSDPKVSDYTAFKNMISTIQRRRSDVKTFVFFNAELGSIYNPLLEGLGIYLQNLKVGVYKYTNIDKSARTGKEIENVTLMHYYGDKGQTDVTRASFLTANGVERSIVNGEIDVDEFQKIEPRFFETRRDIKTTAFRVCKQSVVLYVYFTREFAYVTDKRVKNACCKYFTIWDSATSLSASCFNFESKMTPVIKFNRVISRLESKGAIYFNSDNSGGLFNACIHKVAHL